MRKSLFFALSISFFSLFADTFQVRYDTSLKECQSLVAEHLVSEFPIKEVIYTSDGGMSQQEFFYLTELKEGLFLTQELLLKALLYLQKKHLFRTIFIDLSYEKEGVVITFDCRALWTIKTIIFKDAAFVNKSYKDFYRLHSGMPFEKEEHKKALEGMLTALWNTGYKNASCKDLLTYNADTKTVTITLLCSRGAPFFIRALEATVAVPENDDEERVHKKVQAFLRKELLLKQYNSEMLETVTKKMKKLLIKLGWPQHTVTYNEEIDTKKNSVSCHFFITLEKKRAFVFSGNHFFSEEQLLDMVTKIEDSSCMMPVTLLAEDIALSYHKEGFWKAHVVGVKDDETDIFTIDEGPRVAIKKAIVKGAETFDATWLARKFFYPVIKQRFFNTETVEQAVDSLIQFYRSVGFLDVALLKKDFKEYGSAALYELLVTIDEGVQSFVETILIPGYEKLLLKEPFYSLLHAKKAVPFTKDLLYTQKEWLSHYFKKMGYYNVQITSEVTTEEKSKVTICWKVDLKEKLYCNKVIVEGALPTDFTTFMRHVDYKKEHPWKKDVIQTAQLSLHNADLFKYIHLQPEAVADAPDFRNLLVRLEEKSPYEVRMRFGFQQVSKNFAFKKGSTYKAGTTLLWRNLTGHADQISFNANFTRFERVLEGVYKLPFIGGSPFSTLFKVYTNKYIQPLGFGSRHTLYQANQQGFLMNIGMQKKAVNIGTNIGFEWMETKDISQEIAAAINFTGSLIDKKIPYFFFEPNVYVDLLDDKLNPTKGLFLVASVKGMVPLKHSTYILKLLLEKGIFFPLFKNRDIIFAGRFRFGHIFNETFSSIMPPERFYLGGANSLRGYQPDGCPPLGTIINEQGLPQRVPQGGKSMVNMNVEIRIPVTKQLGVVLFQDFGVLVKSLMLLHDRNNNLAASGFGVRYMTPIGPLRFDIGFKWQKEHETDSRYAWFLTFGHAF